jgi:hypothetical protein
MARLEQQFVCPNRCVYCYTLASRSLLCMVFIYPGFIDWALRYPTLPYPSGTLRERGRFANGNASRTLSLP